MDDYKFSRQNKCNTLQKMDDFHSFCTDTPLHGIDGLNQSSEINKINKRPLEISNI